MKRQLGVKIPSATKIICAALALIIVFGNKYKFFVPVRASYLDRTLLSHCKRDTSTASAVLKSLNSTSPCAFPVIKPLAQYAKTWLYLCGDCDPRIPAVVNHFYQEPSCFGQLCRSFSERIDRKLLKSKFIEEIPEKELQCLRQYAKMKGWENLSKVPLRETLDKDLFLVYNRWSKQSPSRRGFACSPSITNNYVKYNDEDLLSVDKRSSLDQLDNPDTIKFLERNIFFKDEPNGRRAWFRPIRGLKEQRAFLPARRWIIPPFEQAIVLPLDVAFFLLESVLPFKKYQSLPLVKGLASALSVDSIPVQHKLSNKKINVKLNKRKYLLMRELFCMEMRPRYVKGGVRIDPGGVADEGELSVKFPNLKEGGDAKVQ